MVGLAFEVHDTANMKKSAESPDAEEKTKLKYEYQKVAPSFTDVILYSYCYIGLLTGRTCLILIYYLDILIYYIPRCIVFFPVACMPTVRLFRI